MTLDAAFVPPPPPPPPSGHGLLAGKVVIVTAAAGTGIGFATAERCREEGALVVLSDAHERRLAESVAQLNATPGTEAEGVPCDVTRQEDVDRLYATVVERLRAELSIGRDAFGRYTLENRA